MSEFHDCLLAAGLSTLPMKGNLFTWFNQSDEPRALWKRLDRALANEAWLNRWPKSFYISSTPRTSDRSPLILQGGQVMQGPSVFRFDNYLAKHSDFLPEVGKVWQHNIYGAAMYGVVKKTSTTETNIPSDA
ncbi:UNVERIFIED_CONTAM: hypothetical protein Sradi_2081100 [Sesamum radiatum]|uniref:Uncharacterized protein n=1 Tax=Sesamum radiatum TaxID=300843 RepID=A0AAW2TJR7_SESRA